MSWDVYVSVEYDDGQWADIIDSLDEGGSWGYTWNVAPMLYDATDGIGLRDSIDGKPAIEAADAIERMVVRLEADPAKYRAMNPENGWGSYDGIVKELRRLIRICRKAPKATVFVS